MGANSKQDTPPAKEPKHIDMVVTVTFICGNCGEEIGTPETFQIKETGGRGQVEAEGLECPFCTTQISHKKLVVTEPV
jgi:hypothetical protein